MISYLGLAVVLLTSFLFSALPAKAENQTKLVVVNGEFSLQHKASYYVLPEDNIDLGAQDFDIDEFDDLTNEELVISKSKQRDPDSYEWSAKFSGSSRTETCDLSVPNTCIGTSFEPTPYGVSFSVPAGIGKHVKITVRNRMTGSYAEMFFVNKSYVEAEKESQDSGQSYVPAQTAVTEESEYQGSDYNYNRMLTAQGQWKYIPGTLDRVWVPYGYMPVGEWATWNPYLHGRWVWTSYGWTWHSYDPFGYVTSHYGVWRYNVAFGWVWMPFPAGHCVYRPFVGSFFYTANGIGWSPFWGGYWWGYTGGWNPYQYGYNYGYRDGYWDGYWAGRNSGNRYGWVYVSNGGFTSVNIYTSVHRETNYVTVVNNYNTVYEQGHFGENIGDRTYTPAHPRVADGSLAKPDMASFKTDRMDRMGSHQLMETRVGAKIAEEAVNVRKLNLRDGKGGTVEMVGLKNVGQRPDIYTKAADQAKERVKSGRSFPVGSVVDADSGKLTARPAQIEQGRTGSLPPSASRLTKHRETPSKTIKPGTLGVGTGRGDTDNRGGNNNVRKPEVQPTPSRTDITLPSRNSRDSEPNRRVEPSREIEPKRDNTVKQPTRSTIEDAPKRRAEPSRGGSTEPSRSRVEPSRPSRVEPTPSRRERDSSSDYRAPVTKQAPSRSNNDRFDRGSSGGSVNKSTPAPSNNSPARKPTPVAPINPPAKSRGGFSPAQPSGGSNRRPQSSYSAPSFGGGNSQPFRSTQPQQPSRSNGGSSSMPRMNGGSTPSYRPTTPPPAAKPIMRGNSGSVRGGLRR